MNVFKMKTGPATVFKIEPTVFEAENFKRPPFGR